MIDEVKALRIEIAALTAERDRLETAARAYIEGHEHALARAETAEQERDALRAILQDINNLLMSVPPGEDWRAVVRKKVVVALFGEPGWKET